MKEICEFLVAEAFASRIFDASEGKRWGGLAENSKLQLMIRALKPLASWIWRIRSRTKLAFFYGWDLRRRYSKAEFKVATLLFPSLVDTLESAGKVRKITGGDKIVREFLKIPGAICSFPTNNT